MKILSKIKPINGADFKIADAEDIAIDGISVKEKFTQVNTQVNAISVQLEDFYKGESDYTNAFKLAIKSLRKGGTILLDCKEYNYSDSIILGDNISLMCLNGYATLKALNLNNSCIQLGNNSRMENLILNSIETTTRSASNSTTRIFINGADNIRIKNVLINGGNSVGMMIANTNNFVIEKCTVMNTLADGIHITDGSKNGIIQNNFISNVGDDGIACVSYNKDTKQVFNIKILNNTVYGTKARGITSIGSDTIYIQNNTINNTYNGSINIAQEGSYDTMIPANAYIKSNICKNYTTNLQGLGAISILGAEGIIEIDSNTILDTTDSAVSKLPLLFDCPNATLRVSNNSIKAKCSRYFTFKNTDERYKNGVSIMNNTGVGGNCTQYSEIFLIDNFIFINNVFKDLSATLEKDFWIVSLKNAIIENNNLFRTDNTKAKVLFQDLYESRVGINSFNPVYACTNNGINPYDNSYEWNNILSSDLGMVIPFLKEPPVNSQRSAKFGALMMTGTYPNYYLQVRYGTNNYAKIKLDIS